MAETEDDAWLEQLREALASTASDDDADADRDPFARRDPAPRSLTAHPGPTAQPAAPAGAGSAADAPAADLGPVLDAIASLNDRLSALESSTRDLARDSRRSMAPDINQVEAAITRVLRVELPGILDSRMTFPSAAGELPSAERVELDDASAGDVVALARQMHHRIAELEDLHRRALEDFTGERRQLIDEAVSEIRRLLFGD